MNEGTRRERILAELSEFLDRIFEKHRLALFSGELKFLDVEEVCLVTLRLDFDLCSKANKEADA